MPFLRFSRDKRGYENTYVLHTYRREGRSHPRLLYWFRTPPGVRVGRHPLDERAIKAIEEGNPNLSFDWSKMLKVRPEPPPESRRPKGKQAGKAAGKTAPSRGQRRPRRDADESPAAEARAELAPETTDGVDSAAGVDPADTSPAVAEESTDQPVDELVAEAASAIVPGVAADNADVVEQEEVEPDEPWQHPVVTLMGEEMLARLRARYSEIQVRIAEKRTDTEALDEIRGRAKALDPDRWKTLEDAVKGIERFESEAEAIRNALGRRPPRTRRT